MKRHTFRPQEWQDRPSARSLLFTVLGEYVYPADRPVRTKTFARALAALGFEAPTTRQALSRSAAAGWLTPERRGRETLWHLTRQTRGMLATGTERIYSFGRGSFGRAKASWSGEWLLLHVELPDANRKLRQRLRTRLTWAGFGFLNQSLWISPDPSREGEAAEVLDTLGLTRHATSFRADAGSIGNMEELVHRAWDLDAIAEQHRGFLSEADATTPATPEASFVALTRLVHRWRSLPFVDPDLPDALLPPRWVGRQSARRFHRLHGQWSEGAQEWWAGSLQ